MRILLGLTILVLASSPQAHAYSIQTNSAKIQQIPDSFKKWLTQSRVQRVIDRVESLLQWDIRRINVTYLGSPQEFAQGHGLTGADTDTIVAVALPKDGSILLGPKVNESNFDAVFAHELTHVVVLQKYKSAVPKWIEEGLANYVGKKGKADYAWLAGETSIDPRELTHPFVENRIVVQSGSKARFHYELATAETTCDTKDLKGDLAKWIKKKAARK